MIKLLGFRPSESPGSLKLQPTSGRVELAGQNQDIVTGQQPAMERVRRKQKALHECEFSAPLLLLPLSQGPSAAGNSLGLSALYSSRRGEARRELSMVVLL